MKSVERTFKGVSPLTINQIMDKTQAKRFIIYDSTRASHHSMKPCQTQGPPQSRVDVKAGSLSGSQFWAVQKGYALMLEYEREKGFKYDFVVRFRPDVIYSKFEDRMKMSHKIHLPFDMVSLIEQNKTTTTGVGSEIRQHNYSSIPAMVWGVKFGKAPISHDHFFVTTRPASDVHFNFEDSIAHCHFNITNYEQTKCHEKLRRNSECLWYRHDVNHNVIYNLSYYITDHLEIIRVGIPRFARYFDGKGGRNNNDQKPPRIIELNGTHAIPLKMARGDKVLIPFSISDTHGVIIQVKSNQTIPYSQSLLQPHINGSSNNNNNKSQPTNEYPKIMKLSELYKFNKIVNS